MINISRHILSVFGRLIKGLRSVGSLFFVAAIILVLGAGASVGAEGKKSLLAPQLKAVYLYNFFNFVNWPDGKKLVGDKSLRIGVIGNSPIGRELDIVKEKVSENKGVSLEVLHYGSFKEGTDYSKCHIVFISRSEQENFSKIIDKLSDLPVLTVLDAGDFVESGGMINLVNVDNRIRFQINRSAASAAGLQISAQLLKAALLVR